MLGNVNSYNSRGVCLPTGVSKGRNPPWFRPGLLSRLIQWPRHPDVSHQLLREKLWMKKGSDGVWRTVRWGSSLVEVPADPLAAAAQFFPPGSWILQWNQEWDRSSWYRQWPVLRTGDPTLLRLEHRADPQ